MMKESDLILKEMHKIDFKLTKLIIYSFIGLNVLLLTFLALG